MSVVIDGTAGITTPGLTNTGTETLVNLTTTGNTILGDASTDTLNVGNGGLIKDASGNVGIGVTPSAWGSGKAIEIGYNGNAVWSYSQTDSYLTHNAKFTDAWRYVSSAAASTYRQSAGSHNWQIAASGTAGNAITFTQAMTLTNNNELVLGGTTVYNSASGRVSLNLNGSTMAVFFGNGTTRSGSVYHDNTDMEVANDRNGILAFKTNALERGRFDQSGNLLVGTTNTIIWNTTNTGVAIGGASAPAIQVSRSGDTALLLNRLASDGAIQVFARQGTQVGRIDVTTTATAYVTSSDYRLKHDIQPMTGALAKVAALKPCTYKWKTDGSEGEGFIAHELAEVCPSAVYGEKDAVNEDGSIKPQGIDTSFLVATLTAAIQEQQALIQILTDRITALENK